MSDIDFSPHGLDLFGNPIEPKRSGKIADNFLVPPFSVLNAREGWWQERKRAWLAYGIKSEVGRGGVGGPGRSIGQDLMKGENGTFSSNDASPRGSARPACDYRNRERGDGEGRPILNATYTHKPDPGLTWVGGNRSWEELDEGSRKILAASSSGTSIFDPTLTELAYRWFCPPGGQILDPFAGGSVRGIVAVLLGYRYWGCDLRQEQIQANEQQALDITPDAPPIWVCGDSIERIADDAPEADFIFTCPPYGDLERYSDDPRDLSTMDYHAFIFAMRRIVLACYAKLRQDRFACFVVGDFRDKRTGFYRNFVSDTIDCFKRCGFELYNEAILITAVGSLPIRITSQFKSSRKLGKTHQNVLVFVKGDPRRATVAITNNRDVADGLCDDL
jgi:DNA modification methylase